MNKVTCCQVPACPYLASIRIGHAGDLAYMCRSHRAVFRASQIPEQRRMLAEVGPPRRFLAAGHVSCPPSGFE